MTQISDGVGNQKQVHKSILEKGKWMEIIILDFMECGFKSSSNTIEKQKKIQKINKSIDKVKTYMQLYITVRKTIPIVKRDCHPRSAFERY